MIKLLLNGIVVVPMLLWFTEATFWQAFWTSLALSVIAYPVGDQLILRASNNTVATLADAGLALVVLWIAADYMNWTLTTSELLAIAIVLSVVEAIFHRMLSRMDKQAEA